jgi:hypothetical protein
LGFRLIILFSCPDFKLRNLWLFIFRGFDAELRLVQRVSRRLLFVERGATMPPGLPFKVSRYKSILAFPISRLVSWLQIIFVIGHPCLSYPGVTSPSGV